MTCGRLVVFSRNPVSSTNKTDRYDVTGILLKVALNTITITLRGCTPQKIYLVLLLFLSCHSLVYIFLYIHMYRTNHRKGETEVIRCKLFLIWSIKPTRCIYITEPSRWTSTLRDSSGTSNGSLVDFWGKLKNRSLYFYDLIRSKVSRNCILSVTELSYYYICHLYKIYRIEKTFSSHSLSYIINLTVFCYLIIS